MRTILYPIINAECSLLINCSVQSYWNLLENLLITVTDLIAPIAESKTPSCDKKKKNLLPSAVNSKINKSNRLLNQDRLRSNNAHYPEIKKLSLEIKKYFYLCKKERVQRIALGTGSAGNLWKAVKIAKNVNQDIIPQNLTLGGIPVAAHDVPNAFAGFFSNKITTHVNKTSISVTVYNGKKQILVQNLNFMTKKDVEECMNSLKSKHCEGYNRIPVCILADARDILLDPMSDLFQKNYATGLIPEQWKV